MMRFIFGLTILSRSSLTEAWSSRYRGLHTHLKYQSELESNQGPLIHKQAVQTATLPPRPNHDGVLAPKDLIWFDFPFKSLWVIMLGFHKRIKLCTIHKSKRVCLMGGSNSIAFYKSWDVCSLNEVFPLKLGGKSLQSWASRKLYKPRENQKYSKEPFQRSTRVSRQPKFNLDRVRGRSF